MSTTNWTKEQLEAITQNGCNILVAAAAGSGKTAVLVERIIRKISDPDNPLDIDKLLVVTFTNAAALEMRERIGLALEKSLDGNPQSEHLQHQLALLDKASIMTLHSFCLNVVKSNFHILELDPVFRIAEETETTLMKLDILEELFENKYEDPNTDSNFYKLVECYGGGKSDQGLQDMVVSIFEFIQSHPWPEKWLDGHVEELSLPEGSDLCNTAWGRIIIENVSAELEGLFSILEEALLEAGDANGLQPYVSCLENDMDQLVGLQKSLTMKLGPDKNKWDEICSSFNSFAAARLPRCGKDADSEVQERVKAARKTVKDGIAKIAENAFCTPSSEIIQDLNTLYPLFKTLASLISEFGSKYIQIKRDKALLDFNDLEHLCLKLLMDNGIKTPVAVELSNKYEEILVDEYQDSNLIQEVIINAISREESGHPNVFMVGDVKQSIYRFRQARPDLFLSKYNTYSDKPGMENLRILLYRNFRSRSDVINGVNFIFKQIMSCYVGELDYTDVEALNPGAVFQDAGEDQEIVGGPVEVDIIDLSGNAADANGGSTDVIENDAAEELHSEPGEALQENEDEGEQLDAIQQEARLVANRIRQLVDCRQETPGFKVFDNKQKCYKKAEYKDMVILLRTTRNWADVFAEELALQGIPAFADAGSGYFKTIEIQTMISLLQIIDNPLQDIPLLAVLRSPIFLFNAGELSDIRLADRTLPYIEAVKKYSEENQGELSEKCMRFISSLEKWRNKAAYASIDEFIWYLYAETSYYSYVGILPGGKQRQANLRMLYERARQYEDTSFRGLFNFVNFIDRLKSGGGDFGSAKILGENENVVRIMSIHKSKGLEFPVVFVSGCGKRFNLQDMNGKALLHQDLGFGPDLVDIERRITYPVAPKHAIKYKIRQETLSEEMRILYVAFTRAKEKLIITGAVKDLAKSMSKWNRCACNQGEKLPDFDMLRACTYLDWICPALIRHKDGGTLRFGDLKEADECGSTWDIRLHSPENTGCESTDQKSIDELMSWLHEIKDEVDSNTVYNQISDKMEWEYRYKDASGIPAKFSVTELKRRFRIGGSDEPQSSEVFLPALVEKPSFMDDIKGFTSAEKGTIMHFVMQHLELGRIRQVNIDKADMKNMYEEIKEQISSMVKDEFITMQEAETVEVKRIIEFFKTELGRRMLEANEVKREVPFTIELDLTELYKDMPVEYYKDEKVLLQGVIDCYMEEEAGLVLLDYKTDYIQGSDFGIIKKRYGTQLDYYTRALEAMTGKNVIHRYIYMFYNGMTLSL